MDEEPQVEERFIKLTEGEGGQFRVESNIENWPQQLKLLVAAMRDTEVKQALGV